MFYVAYRTLLVMFSVLKYYFVDFNGMFTSFQGCQICLFGSLKMHVLCKVGKNIIFQNKTFLVILVYRQNKTFWYQFCNFKHFLKAENSEDSLASSWHSKPMVSSVTLLELSDCWHYMYICPYPRARVVLVWGCSEELHYDRLAISPPLRLQLLCICIVRVYTESYVDSQNSLFCLLTCNNDHKSLYMPILWYVNLPKLNVKVIQSP